VIVVEEVVDVVALVVVAKVSDDVALWVFEYALEVYCNLVVDVEEETYSSVGDDAVVVAVDVVVEVCVVVDEEEDENYHREHALEDIDIVLVVEV
jgi:hypothetical protein